MNSPLTPPHREHEVQKHRGDGPRAHAGTVVRWSAELLTILS